MKNKLKVQGILSWLATLVKMYRMAVFFSRWFREDVSVQLFFKELIWCNRLEMERCGCPFSSVCELCELSLKIQIQMCFILEVYN